MHLQTSVNRALCVPLNTKEMRIISIIDRYHLVCDVPNLILKLIRAVGVEFHVSNMDWLFRFTEFLNNDFS